MHLEEEHSDFLVGLMLLVFLSHSDSHWGERGGVDVDFLSECPLFLNDLLKMFISSTNQMSVFLDKKKTHSLETWYKIHFKNPLSVVKPNH